MSYTTRTGNFPIGFRRGWGDWQKNLATAATWAKDAGFATIDLGAWTADDAVTLKSAGLSLISVDLLEFNKLCAVDEGVRKEVVARNVVYIKEAAAGGAKVFFTIMPAEHVRKRHENYRVAVESFAPIAEAATRAGVKIAIEGYPGGPPHYSLLCTTPETCRSFIKDLASPAIGLNYDPSHLIRLGVDPIRFLNEFLPHVVHVHGKDTEIMPEAVYEYGLYQDAVFAKGHGFGQNVWRYTIPGHGMMRWTEAFSILSKGGYKGAVCIELEDEHFNGTEAGDKAGLVHGLNFLRGA